MRYEAWMLDRPRGPGFYPEFTRSEYEKEVSLLAHRLEQLGLGGEVGVLRGCVSHGGRHRGQDELVPVKRLCDVRWHFDPAASCARRRAFVDTPSYPSRRFVLGAFEDGSWYIEERLIDLAGGDAKTLVDAQVAALRVLTAFVPLPEGTDLDDAEGDDADRE